MKPQLVEVLKLSDIKVGETLLVFSYDFYNHERPEVSPRGWTALFGEVRGVHEDRFTITVYQDDLNTERYEEEFYARPEGWEDEDSGRVAVFRPVLITEGPVTVQKLQ